MTAAALPAANRRPSAEARQVASWAACWLLLPNAGFVLLWTIGAPQRVPEILATCAVGLLVRRKPWAVKLTAFSFMLLYSVLSFIAALFNLSPHSLIASLRFLGELDPAASPEYPVLTIGLVATFLTAARLLRAPSGFREARSLLLAAGLAGLLAGADTLASGAMRGHYKRSAPSGAPFASGVGRSGFAEGAAAKRHLVLVMVESLGTATDPRVRARALRRWRRPDIAARYEVTTGTTPFFGSTTAGEVRELCGRWGDYPALVDRADRSCLPARLRGSGYRTTAFHAFEGRFFDRRDWYPNIGFDRMVFGDELIDGGAEVCAGVFPGACDRDVPRLLGDTLARADRPQFIYWLTLNSHLPVPDHATLRVTGCSAGEMARVAAYPMICRQHRLWDEVFDGLARQLVRDDMPAVDVLLVGDHMPPYFDRRQRAEFLPDQVPWVLLRRR